QRIVSGAMVVAAVRGLLLHRYCICLHGYVRPTVQIQREWVVNKCYEMLTGGGGKP
ncbi:MAG: hypothetical protein H6Q20_1884, partial [Bacteroidetes bacterium]|nr:hypothetical protein [Bacteroidota bacterium]